VMPRRLRGIGLARFRVRRPATQRLNRLASRRLSSVCSAGRPAGIPLAVWSGSRRCATGCPSTSVRGVSSPSSWKSSQALFASAGSLFDGCGTNALLFRVFRRRRGEETRPSLVESFKFIFFLRRRAYQGQGLHSARLFRLSDAQGRARQRACAHGFNPRPVFRPGDALASTTLLTLSGLTRVSARRENPATPVRSGPPSASAVESRTGPGVEAPALVGVSCF
jgi:hypothetical protein